MYVHTYVCTYLHTCIHTYIHTCIFVLTGDSYAGKLCEYPSCPKPEGTDKTCNNKGICFRDHSKTLTCLCDPGYSGVACDIPDCPGDPECGGQFTQWHYQGHWVMHGLPWLWKYGPSSCLHISQFDVSSLQIGGSKRVSQ